MTAFDDRVAQVRELLARTGGWNARTRAALVSWARVEGVGEAELARILEVVLAIRSHHAAPPASTPEPPLPRAAPPRTRWIATALVVIGLAHSIALLRLLVERIGAMPQRVKTPTQVAVRETVAAPERTLPPPPVSFPTPPTLAPIASGTTTSQVEPLGARPEGDLSAADLQAWRQAFVLLAGSSRCGARVARGVDGARDES
jgi:hypothetical protein